MQIFSYVPYVNEGILYQWILLIPYLIYIKVLQQYYSFEIHAQFTTRWLFIKQHLYTTGDLQVLCLVSSLSVWLPHSLSSLPYKLITTVNVALLWGFQLSLIGTTNSHSPDVRETGFLEILDDNLRYPTDYIFDRPLYVKMDGMKSSWL